MASQQLKSPAMSKGWNIIEKIIAVILAAASLFVLYNEVSLISTLVSNSSKGGSTFISLFKTHHLALIASLFGLFGGCMMLFNDKRGWIFSLISLASFGILFYISSRTNATDKALAFASFYKSYGITSLICFVLFIILLWKPFRKKYNPTLKNWLWLVGIIILFLIDKLVL